MDVIKNLNTQIYTHISQHFLSIKESDVQCVSAKSSQNHDYQSSLCLRLAKNLHCTPIAMAQRIVEILRPLSHVSVEVSGPGFLNVTLNNAAISQFLQEYHATFAAPLNFNQSLHILVDYSSPNIAKELHVGHLRSTIIGDVIANAWEWSGAKVTRINHLGDWGTAFGMLLAYLKRHQKNVFDQTLSLSDLMIWYQDAKKEFDETPQYYEDSKQALVLLQAGHAESLKVWKQLCVISQMGYQKIYNQLDIKGLQARGESFYQPWLAQIVEQAQTQNLLSYSDGAACIFLDGFQGRDGTPLPLIIQKSDGGFNYATTDLAAVQYRIQTDRADKVFYVTDNGQKDHFAMIFSAAYAMALSSPGQLIHVPFGVVQNAERKRYKTRSGGVVPLQDLLDEAYERALAVAVERSIPEQHNFAKIVGFGAIKYADLSTYRLMDYVFDVDKMLSFEGNTIVYILYSLVRAKSLLKKAGTPFDSIDPLHLAQFSLNYSYTMTEKRLILQLLKFEQIFKDVLDQSAPHFFCDYLYELSVRFNHFFRDCPVLNNESTAQRLLLVFCVATEMTSVLHLLGIQTLDEM